MIPPYDADGNLPPGIHEASWDEVVARFGWSEQRQRLLEGLRRALDALAIAGCTVVYLDGSFVSSAESPADYDGCWDLDEVDLRRLDPTLFDFDAGRRAQKRKYGGEMFPASFVAGADGELAIDFFQLDKQTRQTKGIVAIDVGRTP